MRSHSRNELNRGSISLLSGSGFQTLPRRDGSVFGDLPQNGHSQQPRNVLHFTTNGMVRLPGYDCRHNRPEKLAFLTLYLLGLIIVTVAIAGGGSFAVQKDQICQTLTSNLVAAAKAAAKSTDKPAAVIQLKTGAQTAGAPRPGTPES